MVVFPLQLCFIIHAPLIFTFHVYAVAIFCAANTEEMTAAGFVDSGKVPIAVLCAICGAELLSFTCTLFCVFSPYATKLCGAQAMVVYGPRFLCMLVLRKWRGTWIHGAQRE